MCDEPNIFLTEVKNERLSKIWINLIFSFVIEGDNVVFSSTPLRKLKSNYKKKAILILEKQYD
jgi:hypothetical protein